jgi:predicted Zn-dependent protease
VQTRTALTVARFPGLAILTAVALSATAPHAGILAPSRARISEEVRTIPTYPFSEPNGVPILAKDTRLYPYYSFEGYAHESVPKAWKVVKLENDWIEVLVLPEVGGKVWGARVKKSGHDFIYRNEVLKFRNIALRGPWTSGGIEFNFGVVGHTPSTATPVDYALRDNADGSVSCIVGTMDLSSRTEWRVEIRLQSDKAAFETNVLWHNPTPLEQPYYNWMTAAAFAKNDLTMTIPGNAYLDHTGPRHDWPFDAASHYLPSYADNQFGSHKSFHVVGELQDVFGGYYADAGFGFGHWTRHEEMPGQKLWLWALSRAGGIWEDLLTDTNGQYVEYQAGRLLVQYTPGADQTPIRQAGFDPLGTDRWSETWFPLEGTGGLTAASSRAAIAVHDAGGQLTIGINAFVAASDTLRVWTGDRLALERDVTLVPLEPLTLSVAHSAGTPYRVELASLGVRYTSDASARALSRPLASDPGASRAMPEADRLVFGAKEHVQARRLDAARPMLERALGLAPFHHDGLLAMADLEYRRARYAEGLVFATRALAIDTYDAAANFIAANLYRALGKLADARDSYGWATRSLAYRTAANTELAELAMGRSDLAEAERYARIALDFNRANLSAWDILATVGRKTGDAALAEAAAAEILALDPLHHAVAAERYLAAPSAATLDALTSSLRSEFPDQSVLELAIGYVSRAEQADAIALLDAVRPRYTNPLIRAWLAYLKQDRALLAQPADVTLVFPYRLETLPVLTWAARENAHWSWAYLAALNLWGFDRVAEAAALLASLGDAPDRAVFYVTRATLADKLGAAGAEADLGRATALAGADRTLRLPLIQYLQGRSRWADALSASTTARAAFPGDFNLDIMHARSLVHLDRPLEALAILDATDVLPSEGARESHQLYVEAHLEAALADITASRFDQAHAHLAKALEWPEHLGQGRPYDPEERLIRFLMARVDERRGHTADAMKSYRAVADSTRPEGALGALDLVAIPALKALGATGRITTELLPAAGAAATDAGVAAAARALAAGTPLGVVTTRYPRTFGDLDGSLILRALNVLAR